MRLSPLVYADPVGGAFFPVTSTLLAEVYLAPKPTAWDMHAALDDRAAPWVDSLSHDPDGVASAIDRALTEAAADDGRPVLVACKTVIGFGSAKKGGTSGALTRP